MTTPTLGAQRVRLDFNPASNTAVDRIKRATDRSRQHLRPTQTDPNIAHGLTHPQPFRLISVWDWTPNILLLADSHGLDGVRPVWTCPVSRETHSDFPVHSPAMATTAAPGRPDGKSLFTG